MLYYFRIIVYYVFVILYNMDQLLASIDPADPADLPKLKEAHAHLVGRAAELEKAENEFVAHIKKLDAEETSALSKVIEKLAGNLGLQNVGDTVRQYGGEQRDLLNWFKSIEKHVVMMHGSAVSDECIRVAYKASRNAASEFIGRYLRDTKSCTWQDLKVKLESRFGEQVDAHTKLTRIRKYVQKYDQGVQVFGEVILSKASDAFSQKDLEHWFIQKELVLIFVTGLRSKAVARKVMSRDLSTLEEAITCAVEATQRDSRLKAHGLLSPTQDDERDIEPMDVSQVRMSGRPMSGRPSGGQGHRNQWNDGQPICNFCRQMGHMYRRCPQRFPRNAQGKPLN